jgi:hypothetical protein
MEFIRDEKFLKLADSAAFSRPSDVPMAPLTSALIIRNRAKTGERLSARPGGKREIMKTIG